MSELMRDPFEEAQEDLERVWEAAFPMPIDTAKDLRKSVGELQMLVAQMARMFQGIQKQMDEMQQRERQVTLSHEEVQIIKDLIRRRAYEYCEKNDILAPGALRSINAGIKRAILTRYGVKDLHDVPAIARQAVEAQICRWSDIRLMMKCREKLRTDGA